MRFKGEDPKYIAVNILARSICAVKVACCICDDIGVISIGWNHVGNGYGQHAEMHALCRANPTRLRGASIYVAAERHRNGKIVLARPCIDCMPHLKGMHVYWRDKNGAWVR